MKVGGSTRCVSKCCPPLGRQLPTKRQSPPPGLRCSTTNPLGPPPLLPSLVEAGDGGLASLRKRIADEQTTSLSAKEVDAIHKWIADLESDSFQLREKATAELKRLGDAALPELDRALETTPPYETRIRIAALLECSANRTATPSIRRRLRLVQALEQIGTPQANKMLAVFSKLADQPDVVDQSADALARLSGRAELPTPALVQ